MGKVRNYTGNRKRLYKVANWGVTARRAGDVGKWLSRRLHWLSPRGEGCP